MDLGAVSSFMRRHRYGVVSSLSSSGMPQSALVGIATTPQLEIVFDTLKSSRKYTNLTQCALCSFVVGWEGEQTIQVEGTALQMEGSQLGRYKEAYFEVWPEGRDRGRWPEITYFVVIPTWIRYCDYDQNPPLIVEWSQAHLEKALAPVVAKPMGSGPRADPPAGSAPPTPPE